jgi:hypothetical protein
MKIEHNCSRKKDLFIFDRGYFSHDMVEKILSLDKDFIFRLPKNLLMVKNLEGNNQVIILKGKPLRLIRYQIPSKIRITKNVQTFKMINHVSEKQRIIKTDKPFKVINKKNDYYLGTSLIDQKKYPIEVLKEMYHQRWSVEECYKTIKGTFHNGTFHSILPQSIECEMAVQQFSVIMTRLFISLIRRSENQKNNYKITSKKITNEVLPMLLFDKQKNSYLKIICDLLDKLMFIRVPIRFGRSFPRKKRFCSDKFVHKKKELS